MGIFHNSSMCKQKDFNRENIFNTLIHSDINHAQDADKGR